MQGVVSCQIQMFEVYYGFLLFRWYVKGFMLMVEGEQLLLVVDESFVWIEDILMKFMWQCIDFVLKVLICVMCWMLLCIMCFQGEYFDFYVQIMIMWQYVVDFLSELFDVVIVYGMLLGLGVVVLLLFDEWLIFVCVFELWQMLLFGVVGDFVYYMLLYLMCDYCDWCVWFDYVGECGVDFVCGLMFDMFDFVMNVVMQGFGVVIGDVMFVDDDVSVCWFEWLFDIVFEMGVCYFFVYFENFGSQQKICVFSDWIVCYCD